MSSPKQIWFPVSVRDILLGEGKYGFILKEDIELEYLKKFELRVDKLNYYFDVWVDECEKRYQSLDEFVKHNQKMGTQPEEISDTIIYALFSQVAEREKVRDKIKINLNYLSEVKYYEENSLVIDSDCVCELFNEIINEIKYEKHNYGEESKKEFVVKLYKKFAILEFFNERYLIIARNVTAEEISNFIYNLRSEEISYRSLDEIFFLGSKQDMRQLMK